MTNSKTKYVLFLLHLPPPVHGSSVMGKAMYESKDINTAFNCRYINLILSRKVDETGSLSLGKFGRVVQLLFKLLSEIVFHKPQLVYLALTATGAAFYKDVLLVALLRLFRIKIVYHLHNKGFKNAAFKPLNKYLYHFVFKNADVILLSKRLYEDIAEFVMEDRVFVCPNGIPDLVYSSQFIVNSEEKKEEEVNSKKSIVYNEEEKNCKLLFLSNLIESKGVYVLLEACKLLDTKNIDFSCSFIGGESDITANHMNEKIQALGLVNKVEYIGRKYGVEKNTYWKNANIFVLPTYYPNECFPLVLLEAMQYSLPVVSTYEGGIPGIVTDSESGFLVPQKDVNALVDKLELLIKNSELCKQMGEAGRNKYEQEFTLERFEERMVEILKSVNND
jgi:glycosyltransferase involved in cell wall biosynthesis